MAKFSKDNQPAAEKKKRGKDQRTLMLEALERNSFSEEDFWNKVIQAAMAEKESFNQRAMIQEVLLRLSPIPRSVAPTYEFDWDNAASPADKIDRLVAAVAAGEIPADIANMLATTIKSGMDVREVTELAERMEALEKLIASINKGQ